MIYWIPLIASIVLIALITLRRMRLTHQDLKFQKNLQEEEAVEAALDAEELEDREEMDGADAAPKGSVRKTFMKADAHMGRNELEEAEALLLAVIDMDDAHLDAHHKIGMLYMKQGDFPKAELFFSKLVNLKKDPIYLSNLGAALYQQQRLVEAAEAYEQAIALDDKRAARLQSLAQVYYELGEDEKALHYFERASKRKPKDMELKLILADYYEGMELFDQALEQLKKVAEADPYNEEVNGRIEGLSKGAA